MKRYRQTWVEVDLGAIRHNFLQIKKLVHKDTRILVAVKANAYGHGITEVSRLLVREGVDYLGVGTTDEAIFLRSNGIKAPVLVLGSVLEDELAAIVRHNITQTIADTGLAKAINHTAALCRRKARIHVKVDTGMGRLGVWHEKALDFVKDIWHLKNIEIEGIFSHFPSADENETFTIKQIKDFNKLVEELEACGINIRYKHMANSIAALYYKDSHMNLIRPGIMVYGLHPKSGIGGLISLKPAMSLKSRIVFIKDVPAGRGISYGHTHITARHTRIATIPIGYGDGYSRHLSNKGEVLIRGIRAPIAGRVCMDQIMVDVGHIKGAGVGDEVTLIGSQGKEHIKAEEIAHLCATIPYEVACWFDKRIPLVYK